MLRSASTTGLLLTVISLGSFDHLGAQAPTAPWVGWSPGLPAQTGAQPWASRTRELLPAEVRSQTHSHTLTGLLIGGLVGGAATAIFLTAFCGDPDTQCGADEVGRAVLVFAVPPAAVGALIGSLIRTRD